MAYNYNNDISEYYKLICKIPLLSREEEEKLMVSAAAGNKVAQKKLVEANLRFVVKIASLYKGKGLDLEDLVSEGNAGLMIAAQKVDPDKKVRFITYAAWWIRQSITKALYDSGKAVRIPLNRKDEFSTDKWDSVSIYDNIGASESKEISLCDSIADDKYENPEENLFSKFDEESLRYAFSQLSDMEKAIIVYRFGLNGEERLMLTEVGEKLGISREAVRQKEIKILNKIRSFVLEPEYIAA